MLRDEFAEVRVHAEPGRLAEGAGVRFGVVVEGVARDAFAVRYRGRWFAYVNVCRHQLQPLDFGDAHFFDDAFDALVCCHHGARYRPETGECFDGPCRGARLTALALETRDGALWCVGLRAEG
jgi:nitrite reductase/ring-hydroxylating ferredoxin subunit